MLREFHGEVTFCHIWLKCEAYVSHNIAMCESKVALVMYHNFDY